MKIYPVLDLLGDRAVHAIGGIRHEYQPLQSLDCETPCPIEISSRIRERFGLTDWYVADLNGIVHRDWNRRLIARLAENGLSLRVDWGLCDVEDLFEIGECPADSRMIIATEVLRDRSVFDALSGMMDPARMTFSLDLIEGALNAPHDAWHGLSIEEIVGYVAERGVREIIVLDLAYVGCSLGLGTLPVCERLREQFPDLELITGGGVRDLDDLRRLEEAGLDAVLLGSSLHSGAFSPECLSRFTQTGVESVTRSNING